MMPDMITFVAKAVWESPLAQAETDNLTDAQVEEVRVAWPLHRW
jgi:hypothetical protein